MNREDELMLDERYTFNRVVGRGAYGIVVACHDNMSGKDVAIKKITHAFKDTTDSKRVLREVMLLQHLRHENIVSLLDILCPRTSVDKLQDVYIVMDLMETDLHRIIHSNQPLSEEHVQFFLSQILRALHYLHSGGVLHRDLKPSNLLVNASCDLKVCDFGLARGLNEDDPALTEYVVTRWYRAPEVMLSSKSYTYGVDVWSTGCIMAELLMRRPLFKGEDYIHQLQLINEILGSATEEELKFVSSDKARNFLRSLPQRQGVDFARVIPHASEQALDLLRKMLTFDPSKRITVIDALNHPFLSEFPIGEEYPAPVCDTRFEFKYEGVGMDVNKLRQVMWKEMTNFHPELMHNLHEPPYERVSVASELSESSANKRTIKAIKLMDKDT